LIIGDALIMMIGKSCNCKQHWKKEARRSAALPRKELVVKLELFK